VLSYSDRISKDSQTIQHSVLNHVSLKLNRPTFYSNAAVPMKRRITLSGSGVSLHLIV